MKAGEYFRVIDDTDVILPDAPLLRYLIQRRDFYVQCRSDKLTELHGSPCWWSDASEANQLKAHAYALEQLARLDAPMRDARELLIHAIETNPIGPPIPEYEGGDEF